MTLYKQATLQLTVETSAQGSCRAMCAISNGDLTSKELATLNMLSETWDMPLIEALAHCITVAATTINGN